MEFSSEIMKEHIKIDGLNCNEHLIKVSHKYELDIHNTTQSFCTIQYIFLYTSMYVNFKSKQTFPVSRRTPAF